MTVQMKRRWLLIAALVVGSLLVVLTMRNADDGAFFTGYGDMPKIISRRVGAPAQDVIVEATNKKGDFIFVSYRMVGDGTPRLAHYRIRQRQTLLRGGRVVDFLGEFTRHDSVDFAVSTYLDMTVLTVWGDNSQSTVSSVNFRLDHATVETKLPYTGHFIEPFVYVQNADAVEGIQLLRE